MTTQNPSVNTEPESEPLPAEWQERAREAARKFSIPVPDEGQTGSAAEAEQKLRQFEQEGGQ